MIKTSKDGNGNVEEFPKRGDIYWITLDPTVGSETKKTRPCVILSNDAQNKKSQRVIIAPITSNVVKIYPYEVKVKVKDREGKVMLDQIRSIDKQRLGTKVASIDFQSSLSINEALKIVLAIQ